MPRDDGEKPVRVRTDRRDEVRVRRVRAGAVRSWGDAGSELREEGLGYGGHCDCAEGVPGEEGIVKLFGDGERGKVPWLCPFVPFGKVISTIKKWVSPSKLLCTYISAKVYILRISSSCDRIGRMRAFVEGVDTAKRINVFLEIGKGKVGTWLERRRVAAR
jgi:hypothetical protein